MTKKLLVFVVIVGAVAAVLARGASATPSSGILSSVFLANAGFIDRVNLRFAIREDHRGHDTIQVRDAENTVMHQIVFAPNGNTGWHSHPGPAVALIKSGELTLYSGDDPTCTGRTFKEGQAFIDSGQGHVHFARNTSQTQNAEVWVTYFDVPPGDPPRVRTDEPAPGNCPF